MVAFIMIAFWVFLNVAMVGLVVAGFKVLSDSADPTTPGALRPSALSAVGSFALAALIFWWVWL